MPRKAVQPLRDYAARRIALIKPSALGDVVHSLPVLTALRRRYPDAHITWVVNRAYEPLLAGHPHLDDTMPFDRGAHRQGLAQGALKQARFFARLRQHRFDLVVDLQGLLRSALMCLVSGARRRVGLSSAREGARYAYTDILPVKDFDALHAVDRYWLVAEALGVGDGPKTFSVPITAEARRWAEETLAGLPRPWLMLAVGSQWVTKRWPPEHYAALVRAAQAEYGGSAVFVGTREEADLADASAARVAGPTRNLSGKTSLPQLAAVLACADVVLGNDSGPLHLAAALGRPVVAPFTCTKILLNGPYGAAASAVESKVWCQGSYLRRCDRLDCMAELTPDRLAPILLGALHTWSLRCRSA
jgi:lipopolysaccharide heptosyltransferase I